MTNNVTNPSSSVIVAVDEPETVEEMVRMAALLSEGKHARIIALTVSLGSAENEEDAIGAIEQIVERLAKQGVAVKSLVVSATSVARGILDVAREYGADMILLGLSRDPAQRSGVGSIAENVAAISPCPVVIYRPAQADIRQVLIACAVTDLSEAALRLGARLAEHSELPLSLVTVGSAQSGGATRRYLRRRLSEAGLDPEMAREHLDDSDPARAIFKRADAQTLLVTGYDYAAPDEQDWFYTRVATALLRGADGAVALVIRDRGDPKATKQNNSFTRVARWLHPVITPVEQRELLGRAAQMSRTSLDYNVLVLIAAILSTLGLLSNSNAVIIGAMLVAPLMSPLIAFAVAIVAGRLEVVRSAVITLGEGFLFAFGVAWLIGMLSPGLIITFEMAARGNPTLLDLGVALAAGVIAAYAQARKDIPAALAGVAIAAALMPPICTVGLGVAIGDMPLYQGALLLFVTNICAIMFAAGATFLYLGVRPRAKNEPRVQRIGSITGVALFGLILAIIISIAVNPFSHARIERDLRAALPDAELINVELRRSDPLLVIATVRREVGQPLAPRDIATARSELEISLNRPVELEVVVQQVVRSGR
ncbi:MAG: DUF389 domain-containing protein [Candidatus Viridilinea halotolerans]|uniref:DUF389 domain-containing protein n=1 Tax=Candidatus Viridilinea halotolerans TaxID=2491704 RepID=A0A426U114_9CHLR|nr:MAG: DUF389 domain-containing protein [Candidatus Viridilinea halotolerans]